MAIKILNVLTSGLRREGITSTQLEFMKKMDLIDIQMDIAAVHNNEQDVIDEFKSLGCNIIVFPDRKEELLKYMVALYKQIRKEKYDVIHVHGSSALLSIELVIARLAGVKIRIAHSRNTMCLNKKADKILRPIFNNSYTKAFACGEEAGKWLFGSRPFTVIHNGKDLEKFHFSDEIRARMRTKYNLQDKLVIGFVGNMNKQKNIMFLIDVFKQVNSKYQNSILFIMGEGADRAKIEEKINRLGLTDSVVLTGRIANVHEMLQAMDVMCLPSLYEGLPNVVLEWQIAGLPCFVSANVTQECKVTDLVEFLPIDQGADIWAEQILAVNSEANRNKLSEDACLKMKEAKFDIKENARYVKSIYMDAVSEIR